MSDELPLSSFEEDFVRRVCDPDSNARMQAIARMNDLLIHLAAAEFLVNPQDVKTDDVKIAMTAARIAHLPIAKHDLYGDRPHVARDLVVRLSACITIYNNNIAMEIGDERDWTTWIESL